MALGFAAKAENGRRSREVKYLQEILRSDERGLRGDRDGHGDPFFCAPDEVIATLRQAMERFFAAGGAVTELGAIVADLDERVRRVTTANSPTERALLLQALEDALGQWRKAVRREALEAKRAALEAMAA